MRWGRSWCIGASPMKNNGRGRPNTMPTIGSKREKDIMRRLVTIAAALVGLALLLPMIAAAEPVKIALPVNSLESMPIYIAQDKGLFKKHGVEIDVITSRGGGEAMKAYIAGEVQIVATGFPEVGLMRARGVDVELFFAQTSRVPFA